MDHVQETAAFAKSGPVIWNRTSHVQMSENGVYPQKLPKRETDDQQFGFGVAKKISHIFFVICSMYGILKYIYPLVT